MQARKMKRNIVVSKVFLVALSALSSMPAIICAEDSQAELAKKLNNPIACLINVPMQLNYAENIASGWSGRALGAQYRAYDTVKNA